MIGNSKYDINDVVWYITDNKVLSGKVTGVFISIDSHDLFPGEKVSYILNFGDVKIKEEQLFSTKEELLKKL